MHSPPESRLRRECHREAMARAAPRLRARDRRPVFRGPPNQSVVVALALLLSACASEAPRTPATPTPTPAPSISAGTPAKRLPDGRVQYGIIVRADAGVAFLPVSVVASNGEGRLS